ncbi:tRNA (guanosine(46)-N7)-methyltransferase TrmB [Tistrella mobilis]|uniref:tRNA (guanosine(46)-N7)-methyltransferase TrmB n=1 Tax=Tistrella mobilis TaxID=171437 RepID=UPI003558419D
MTSADDTRTTGTDTLADAAGESMGRRHFGRRVGRPLKAGRSRAMEETLPELAITLPEPGTRLDPAGLFDRPMREIVVEIGFGGGEHLIARAEAEPDTGFIGCEPYIGGMSAFLVELERRGLRNVRVLGDDAAKLLDALPDASLARVYLLFSDPWPKRRHNKRRFIQTETVAGLARVLRPGGRLIAATDHPDLCAWTLAHLRAHPDFSWEARRPGDWQRRPDGQIETRYEAKARAAGRVPVFMSFRRG